VWFVLTWVVKPWNLRWLPSHSTKFKAEVNDLQDYMTSQSKSYRREKLNLLLFSFLINNSSSVSSTSNARRMCEYFIECLHFNHVSVCTFHFSLKSASLAYSIQCLSLFQNTQPSWFHLRSVCAIQRQKAFSLNWQDTTQIWMVAVNVLNKQCLTADKEGLKTGRGANKPSP
jgi:hypothetical protein